MNGNQRSMVNRCRKNTLFQLVCLLFGMHTVAFSQIGIWQTHASYLSGQSVAVVGTKVYAATQNGFFYYDKSTGETTTLSKVDGLSDAGISRILYLADQKKILIAYQNGNLDFMAVTETGEPNGVTNVNTIISAPNLPDSRGINHLNRIGTNVYLSTAFGIVVLDITKNEIRDTYIGKRLDGLPLTVFQTTVTADSLYALTNALQPSDLVNQLQAIRFAPTINIADPANWHQVTKPGSRTGTAIESIITNQGRLSVTINGKGVYEQQSGQWVLTQPLVNPIIRQFSAANGSILATDKAIMSGNGSFSGPLLANPREVVVDGNTIWVADSQNGLLVGSAGAFQQIVPDGPARDSFTGLYAYPQTLVPLASSLYSDILMFSVPNARWTQTLIPGFTPLTPGFSSAAYAPTEQRLYLGSFGGGLWSQAEGQLPVPVPLPSTISPTIISLATDNEGNLWISTGNALQALLHVRQPDGQFKSFPAFNQTFASQIVPDDNGFLWIRPPLGSGLIVFDPATNRIRYLTTQTGQGGLPTNSIRALVKDRNGAIWVGTDAGPAIFDNPYGAFDITIDAQLPRVSGRRLLPNEVITAIAVDGGNRKWLGTRSGLYQVAPDGSQLLQTFTAQNSPLPINTVQALAIEPVSGKLFIKTGTDTRTYGLVSYQGTATEPAESLTNLTIFPNPVRPDFSGTVGIRGLTENATVKILDAGGQLVYETRSQGGTASWNLIDYRGRQAQTGVYLVVVVTADGVEGLRGKLAVVR